MQTITKGGDMKVGFIGLGIMGGRMARNLLLKGHDLTVYNRTPAKAEALIAEGAQWAATPADLAQKVDVLFTMLSTPEVVQTLAVRENGFLEVLPEGALWVDCSTVNPGFTRWMAAVADVAACVSWMPRWPAPRAGRQW
jgi:3-hydroxyisobutyrate dehydrogenase-like beta-hydroxyacid dehydrogenase